MKLRLHPILLVLILLLPLGTLEAQRSARRAKRQLREMREAEWPPPRVYNRVSLGHALQRVFERHFNFCGFVAEGGNRDYLPPDITRFLGKRDLRTRVEMADISGGSLLNYVFTEREMETPLHAIHYQPTNTIPLEVTGSQFMLDPSEHFDAFLLTKNCSGYLKASLDAGIEPPYTAFKTALETDDRRESTVVAISGSFVSPVKSILEARDNRTTELMMRLWQYYQQHPEYIGHAYYLREFEGVMIKHLATAEEVHRLESEVGLNVNGPFASHLKAGLKVGSGGSSSFSGSDWETIVFADFEGPYQRDRLFSPLPGPEEISRYFGGIRPIFQKQKDFPLLTEGAEYRHYLIVEGVPAEICRQPWVIDEVQGGVYEDYPSLGAEPFAEANGSYGCRFVVTGRPDRELFKGPLNERPGNVRLAYRIRSQYSINRNYLQFGISEELATSAHPVLRIADGSFDLSKQQDRRFAFQWSSVLEVEDDENPLEYGVLPDISNLLVRRSGENIDVQIARVETDPRRREITIVLETRQTWPLDQIDDLNMVNYNLSMDVNLKTRRSPVRTTRPVKGIISFPSIRPPAPVITEPAPQAIPKAPLPPTENGGSGGGTGDAEKS